MMCMVQDDLTPEERNEQIELMTDVPSLKQKIAGKSLPMEKFAIKKSERFIEQGQYLTLPALGMLALNVFVHYSAFMWVDFCFF